MSYQRPLVVRPMRIVVMRKEGLMSWEEIARKTGLSVRQVRRYYDSAMKKLKIAFEEAGVGAEDADLLQRLRDEREEIPPEILLKSKETR